MKKVRPVVVGIGELLWDILPGGKQAGGAPINFVYHASCLGAEGYAVSAVGNDPEGEEIIQELESNGIKYSLSKVNFPTGYVPVMLKDGIPSYTIVENVAWDHIPLSNEAIRLIKKADAVCYGTLGQRTETSRKTIHTLIDLAPETALKFFDINIRQSYYSKELIEDSLKKASILKVNDEELVLLRELFHLPTENDAACHTLLTSFRLSHLILTAGGEYSSIYTPEAVSTLATPKVEVADTVGAGDAFSGAFIYSILTGKDVREAHRLAVEIAAFVCTRHGAWPEYPLIKINKNA